MFELLMLVGFAYAGFCHLPAPGRKKSGNPETASREEAADRSRRPHRHNTSLRKTGPEQGRRAQTVLLRAGSRPARTLPVQDSWGRAEH